MVGECPGCKQSLVVPEHAPRIALQKPTPTLTTATRPPRATVATVTPKEIARLPTSNAMFASGMGLLGLFMIIFGIALCFTLIGGIIGLPMAIWGFILMGRAPLQAAKSVQTEVAQTYSGPCPYCGYQLTFDGPQLGYDCAACRQRFLIQLDKFVPIQGGAPAAAGSAPAKPASPQSRKVATFLQSVKENMNSPEAIERQKQTQKIVWIILVIVAIVVVVAVLSSQH